MANTPVLKSSEIISNVPLYDNITSIRELMGAKEIPVSFTATTPVYVPVGAYIMFKGEQYTINTVPSVTKAGDHEYQYRVVFESVLYRLYDKKLRHLGNRSFQYFGTPAEYAKLIVDNINEIDSGWAVGACDDLDPKPISFSGHTCRTALDVVAEAFQLEWDETSKVIRFTKQVGVTTPHVFKYGQGKGLYRLSYAYQNDKNIVTRAYGYGSTKNLPEGYRGGATQLMFPEIYLENNVALYGVKEGDYENEDIYPKVAGTISDALDFDLEAGSFKVVDDSLSFNLNDYKSVEVPKLSFTTGELQGQNFDIISYNNTTKTYTLKVFVDGNNLRLPNATFKAQPGDTYTLFDMPLPNELLVAAEAELKAKTLEWLQTNSKPQVLYSLELDPLYARANNILLEPGDRVTIVDEALGINELIRVSKVEYPVNFPEEITPSTRINIEIANFVPYTLTERVLSDIKENKQQVKTTISQGNYIKRMAEYVKTLSGVDYLPPGTAIIDPATGSITANLINADFIVARNVITGKIRITAAANNIRMVDTATNKIIMLLDDDSAYEGEYYSQIQQVELTDPVTGITIPNPNYLGMIIRQENGSDVTYYRYAKRGPGITAGTPGLASASMGRAGFTAADSGNIIRHKLLIDGDSGKGSVRLNAAGSWVMDDVLNKATGLRQSGELKFDVLSGKNIITWDAVEAEALPMYNPQVEADAGDDGYDGGGVVLEPDPPAEPPAGSPTTLLEAGFPLGFMIKTGTLNNANNRASLIAHPIGITPENDYKNVVKSFDPATGAYTTDFSETDPQVIWAKANGKKFHVHTGHWPNHTASWEAALENNPLMTTQKWWDLLKIKMQATLLHLKNDPALDGVADSFDALNEIFLDSNNTASGTLRYKEDVYLRKLGPSYYKQALIWAKEADPRIKIFVNDVNFEYGGYKVENMVAFAAESKTENFPLDGWGLQYHQNCKISSTPTSGTRKNLKLLADTVDHIHLSEVALSLRYNPYYVSGQPFVFTPEMELLQAQKYLALMRYFVLDIPKAKQYRFTTWGIIDPDYMGADEEEFAMLLKADHSRKLAYDYMLNEMIQINSQQELPL